MKYFVTIKSKKDNPNAGETKYVLPGQTITTIISSQELNIEGMKLIGLNKNKYTYQGLHSDKLYSELANYISDNQNFSIEISTSYNQQILHSLSPQPKYIVEYEDIIVECDECNEKFKISELEYDYITMITPDDECVEVESNKICPKCGHWDCCELEYEKT